LLIEGLKLVNRESHHTRYHHISILRKPRSIRLFRHQRAASTTVIAGLVQFYPALKKLQNTVNAPIFGILCGGPLQDFNSKTPGIRNCKDFNWDYGSSGLKLVLGYLNSQVAERKSLSENLRLVNIPDNHD
jgi:hypothetical protein